MVGVQRKEIGNPLNLEPSNDRRETTDEDDGGAASGLNLLLTGWAGTRQRE